MRLLAWVIVLFGLCWTLAVETVEPGQLGIRYEDDFPEAVRGVGSHWAVWAYHDWQTLPAGAHYLRFAGADHLTLLTADDENADVEAVIQVRLPPENARSLLLNEKRRDLGEVIKEPAKGILDQVLRSATAAELRDPDHRRALAQEVEKQLEAQVLQLGLDVTAVAITRVDLGT